MAEVVVPKRWAHNGALRTAGAGLGWVALECEVIQPPSRVGQTVHVVFDPAAVTDMLLVARDAARAVRMTPESGPVEPQAVSGV